jgi:predicted GNAT family N-acyltransferase
MSKTSTAASEEIHAKSRRSSFDQDFPAIHSAVRPQDVRFTDRIVARLRRRNCSEDFIQYRVWRLSPLGVELVNDGAGVSLTKGEPIDLEIVISGQRTFFEGLVVDVTHRTENLNIIGVRLARKVANDAPGRERRAGERWLCSDEFLPTGVAPTPGRFDDFIYFQVRDISGEGLLLSCSLRNKFLIPGMRLGLSVVFPMAEVAQIQVEIVRVAIASFGGRDRLIVGTKFCGISDHARRTLGQYVVQFSNIQSLDDLRAAALNPPSVSAGVDFYNLKSEEDYRSMLELRHLAHSLDGNLVEGATPDDLADINDARSRIIIGKYHGRVVATARIRFNELDEPMEHEAYVEWPKHLPRRDQIFEVSRVATHPNFRRNDLLAALFRYTYLNVVQQDRPWVVMSCLDRMIPFYESLGFVNTGIRHTEPQWRDDRVLNIMMANAFDLILGRNVNPIYWNLVWRDVALHFRSQDLIEVSGIDRIRILLYRAIGPFVDTLLAMRRAVRNLTKRP